MLIPHKLDLHPILLGPIPTPQRVAFDGAQRTEEDADRVPSTNRVPRPVEVNRKTGMRMRSGALCIEIDVCDGEMRANFRGLSGWSRIEVRDLSLCNGARARRHGDCEDVHRFFVQCSDGLVDWE